MTKYTGYTELPSWCIGEINGVHLPKKIKLTKPMIYQILDGAGKCTREIVIPAGAIAEWCDYHKLYIFEETFFNHIINKKAVQVVNLGNHWERVYD